MSFHVGGHKPKQLDPGPKTRLNGRLTTFGAGVLMILVGVYKLGHARLMGWNYLGQPVHTTDFIAVGIVIALCALIPTSWLDAASKHGRRVSRKRVTRV